MWVLSIVSIENIKNPNIIMVSGVSFDFYKWPTLKIYFPIFLIEEIYSSQKIYQC